MAKRAAFHSGFVGIKARAARGYNVSLSKCKRYNCYYEREKKTSAKSSTRADSLTMTGVHRLPTAADLNASALEKPDTRGNAPLTKPHPEHESSSEGCSAIVADGDGWYCCCFTSERFSSVK